MDHDMVKSIEYDIVKDYLENGKDIPIGALIDYTLKCFPDSCFSRNWTNDWDKIWNTNETIIKQAYKLFRYEILNWCGCGDVEGSDNTVMYFLKMCNCWGNERSQIMEEHFGVESIYDNMLLLCLAYTMDAAELTEHGSGIGGAWLTDRGKIFLWVLEKVTQIPDYDSDN